MQPGVKVFLIFCMYRIVRSSPTDDDNLCTGIPYSNICVKLGSKFYLIEGNVKLNWFEADRFCRRQSAFLATIESADELMLIQAYLEKKNYDLAQQWFWISGNDLGSEGIFYTVSTGKLLPFSNWTKGQPDNGNANENCVHLWKKPDIGMNDMNCGGKIHLICELSKRERHYSITINES